MISKRAPLTYGRRAQSGNAPAGYAQSPLRAVIAALQFESPNVEALRALTDAEWRLLLPLLDRTQLAMSLALRQPEALPDWVRARFEENLANRSKHFDRYRRTYRDIAMALESEGIEFLVLKGIAQWPDYVDDPRARPQYDLDLFCVRDQILSARGVLQTLGYEPLPGFDHMPIDHLPAMIRRTGWKWRGDFYDPQMPASVELHFRFWDADTECFGPDGLEEFWNRRITRHLGDLRFTALHPADQLAYTSLHLVRHLLRGDLRLYHAYELAYFLHSSVAKEAFWTEWMRMHPASLRQIQAIAFRLAREMFGCEMDEAARTEVNQLPVSVQRWFDIYALSPVGAIERPNKHELLLHMTLLASASDKRRVLRRRLFPTQRHKALHAAHVPQHQVTMQLRAERYLVHLRLTRERAVHHLRTLPPLTGALARWWWSSRGLSRDFAVFLGGTSIFNFGLTVYFLLYNLHLLQRGFHEDFLGLVASSMTAGSITGAIPAGFAIRRWGLRRVLPLTFVAISLACAVRAATVNHTVLLVSAFAGGLAFSIYAVALAPAVAAFTKPENRAFAFSLVFSLGIGIGVIGALAGGALPSLFAGNGLQPALFIACGLAAFGALPMRRVQFNQWVATEETRIYPRSPFIVRFLAVFLIWNLATGACNPFFNAYFSSVLRMPVGRIGVLFSASHLTQVLAVLAAPRILRRLGIVRGITSMQVATGCALALLSINAAPMLAPVAYAGYMAFQYMSEPGVFSLLMDRVRPEERGGASSLNFFVAFAGQALAALVAGIAVRRFGYGAVLAAAAAGTVAAGVLCRLLLRPSGGSQNA